MSRDELRELVDVWVTQGWLRPLDRAFLQFLETQDSQADALCLLAATLASHQLGRGHICLDLAALVDAPDQTLALPPENGQFAAAAPWPSVRLSGYGLDDWRNALRRSVLVSDGSGTSPLVLAGDRLYLRRYWRYEQQVAESIVERLAAVAPPAHTLRGGLDRLFPQPSGGTGPQWQKIACALAARGRFAVITGGPGTGKTTTVVKLLALLQSLPPPAGTKWRIRLAAPTGKAAARLSESIGNAIAALPQAMGEEIPTEATTLHRLLGSRPGTRQFRHQARNPLHADLVVVDEASMVDLEMMAALLAALRPETRLVLLGDKDQLASVEAGSVLGELCRDAEPPGYSADTVRWLSEATGETVEAADEANPLSQQIALLRISHRFGANSGIGQLARAVNTGKAERVQAVWDQQPPYPDIARLFLRGESDPRLESILFDGGAEYFAGDKADAPSGYRHYLEVLRRHRPTPDAGPEDYDAWAGAVLDAFDDFQLLCALRSGPWGVEGLNRRVADSLFAAGLIRQTQGWYEGRPVLVTRNDYSLGLMNGDIGIVLAFPGGDASGRAQLRVVFRQSDQTRLARQPIKHVLPSRLSDVETVYAMTVHKSQGSEFAHVALVLPDRMSPVLTRELIYTGITRAKQWFSLLLPSQPVLGQAIGQKVRRSGGLAQVLRDKFR